MLPLKIDKPKVLKTDGSLMQVKSIAECSHWSILHYFWPSLSDYWYWKPIFRVLFEWPLKTGFTVLHMRYVNVIIQTYVCSYMYFEK